MGRHPLGDRDHPAVDDQAAVVLAGHERLHDDPPASGLVLRDRERLAHGVLVLEVEAHATAVVAVERLHHDREADPLRHRDGLVGAAHGVLLGDRQPGGTEQPGGEVLVGGDVDRDRGGLRRHRRPDPLGVHALTELHQGVLVEPDPRDVAGDRLVDDRLRGRAERGPLGTLDEGLELGLPVEVRVALHEVVDQAYGEPAGRQADLLVDVAVDDVVDAGAALHLPRLAPPDVVADDLLERQRAVLGDVAEPGPLVEPLDEAAATAAGAGVLAQARQHLHQVVAEVGERVGRELLQRPEVDHEVDGALVGPDVGAAVDAGLEDREVGRGAFAHRAAPSCCGGAVGLLAGACQTPAQRGRRDVGGGDVARQPAHVALRLDQLGGVLGVDLLLAGHQRAGVEVEDRAGGQHVEHHAAGQQRARPLRLVGVGDHPGRVEDRDRALARDPQQPVAVDLGDDRGGVLVDAEAEQLRRLRHDHQQPAVAVALVEVLVDDGRLEQPETGRHLGHPLLRRTAGTAEGDHVGRLDAGAGGGAADHGAAEVGRDDRVADRGAADDRGQLELVAAGHEDPGAAVRAGRPARTRGPPRASRGGPRRPRRRRARGTGRRRPRRRRRPARRRWG